MSTGRAFALHWGSGVVTEEARYSGEYSAPAVQLLEFTDGEAAGSLSIRFCHFDHRGRFQRSPLILSEAEIPSMREALSATPRLRELLWRLVE